MELIMISCIALLFAIGGGITFSKYYFIWVRVFIWGVITVFLLSWSPVALFVGIGMMLGFSSMDFIYLWHIVGLGASCGVFLIVLSIVPLFSSIKSLRRA